MANKKVIYTVITGDYDELYPPLCDQPGWDLICFTDNTKMHSAFWKVRALPIIDEFDAIGDDNARIARLVKILPHRFLQSYDISVYIDANRVLTVNIGEYIKEHKNAKMICFKGVAADAYAATQTLLYTFEKATLAELTTKSVPTEDEKNILRGQIKQWRDAGLPENSGMPGTSVLVRHHNSGDVVAVMEKWAKQVVSGTKYDEVVLPYACHVNAFKYEEGASEKVEQGYLISPAELMAVAVPHAYLLRDGKDLPARHYLKNPKPEGGPYGGYPLLLTIAVPVSNQIGTIRRCLEGLKPLLDAVPSELVVVDTGSKDGTVEVALEFGARVVEFAWINDMAAARNQAIRAARGMWYMSVDDDEWFEDITPIIDFFKNGDYKKAKYANYIQRNYMVNGVDYIDYPAPRMARMHAGLHVEGRIHDLLVQPYDVQGDVVTIEAYAGHLGFFSEQVAAQDLKSVRNVQGLRQDIAQFPYETRYYLQMIIEMLVLKQHAQGYRVGMAALSMCRQTVADGNGEKSTQKLVLQQTLKTCADGAAHRQTLYFAGKYIDAEKFSAISQAIIYVCLSTAHNGLGNYAESIKYLDLFEDCKKQVEQMNAEQLDAILADKLVDPFSRSIMEGAATRRVLNNIMLQKWDTAIELMCSEYLLERFAKDIVYKNFVSGVLCQDKHWAVVCPLLNALIESGDDFSAGYLLSRIMANVYGVDVDAVEKLLEVAFKKWPNARALLSLKKAQSQDLQEDEVYLQAIEFALSIKFDAGFEFCSIVLQEALKLELNVDLFIEKMSAPCVDYIVQKLFNANMRNVDMYDKLQAWQNDVPNDAPRACRYFAMRMNEAVLAKAQKGRDEDRYAKLFENYINREQKWQSELYLPSVFTEEQVEWAGAKVKSTNAAHIALAAVKEKDYVKALKNLRTALESAADIKDAVQLVSDRVVKEYEGNKKKQEVNDTEFKMLLAGVKVKIAQLIDAGMGAQAAGLLSQLEKLAPNDPDLPALKIRAGLLPQS